MFPSSAKPSSSPDDANSRRRRLHRMSNESTVSLLDLLMPLENLLNASLSTTYPVLDGTRAPGAADSTAGVPRMVQSSRSGARGSRRMTPPLLTSSVTATSNTDYNDSTTRQERLRRTIDLINEVQSSLEEEKEDDDDEEESDCDDSTPPRNTTGLQ